MRTLPKFEFERDVFFFLGVGGRGRSPWKSADPVEACGVVEKRGEELVGEVVEELGGRWAGKQIRHLRHRRVRRGVCNPLQPAHSPALSEGLGAPGVDQGAPQGGQESFWHPRK